MSTPIYAFLIALELHYSHLSGLKLYDKAESRNTIFLGFLGVIFDLLMKGACFYVLDGIKDNYSFFTLGNSFWVWLGVFFAQDFCFYWLHRTEHNVRLLWAVHVNHHSSEKYNFSVALRSSALQPIYRYLFFVPCAFLGFSAEQIMVIYTINQVYQFFLHTETVGKYYPWIEAIFVTPSHHRVHHASNEQYLDKNMGQVLIIWDKLFGTFAKEEEKPVYGITKPLASFNPLHVWLHEFKDLARIFKRKDISSLQKMQTVFAKPGFEPESKTDLDI